jgi:hypothetical protein
MLDENIDSGRHIPHDFDSFATRLLDSVKNQNFSPSMRADKIFKNNESAIRIETAISVNLASP